MDDEMRVSVRTILCTAVTVFTVVFSAQAGQGRQIVAAQDLDKNSMRAWDIRSAASVYAYGDFTFSLADASNAKADAQGSVELKIRHGDLPFDRNDFAASYRVGIGIFEMGLEEPVLVIATYSGGAHCCTYFNLLP